jgi:hypothetical protein
VSKEELLVDNASRARRLIYLPTLYNMKMLQRPLGYPRVAICALLFALLCVGVGGMEAATDSACRVLVGIKLKSRKDILLDSKVRYSFSACYSFVYLPVHKE